MVESESNASYGEKTSALLCYHLYAVISCKQSDVCSEVQH